MELIKSILDNKRKGIDCSESESSEIKGWLKETLLSVSDGSTQVERDIQMLFPLEYGEYLEEIENK